MLAGLADAQRIVDYGGGSGWAFEHLNSVCHKLSVTSYTVLEEPSVVDVFRGSPFADSKLKFVPFEDVGLLPPADLLYANASLHYGESEEAFLDAAVTLGPAPYLLLDGYLAHPDHEFFMVQQIYSREVPVRVPHLARSLEDLERADYQVISCAAMLGPVNGEYRYDLPIGHLGQSYAKVRRYSIVARR